MYYLSFQIHLHTDTFFVQASSPPKFCLLTNAERQDRPARGARGGVRWRDGSDDRGRRVSRAEDGNRRAYPCWAELEGEHAGACDEAQAVAGLPHQRSFISRRGSVAYWRLTVQSREDGGARPREMGMNLCRLRASWHDLQEQWNHW